MDYKRKAFGAGWIIRNYTNSGLWKKKLDSKQEKEETWVKG